jgi:serine/threonine protein kinase
VLLPSSCANKRALRDFAEEVSLLSTISHPHIVACYGTGLCPRPGAGDEPFVAMEALTGGDLRTLVTRATMEPSIYNDADVARWALQMAAAMEHLHSREPMVIYRDMKLENVMLDACWNVRITDLGLCKVVLQDPSTRFGRYVMTGGTGSLKYMAPECVKSNKANERVDQYSYAIVLWELLSRKGLLFMRTVRQPNGARVEMTPAMWAEQAIKGARPAVVDTWPAALREVLVACWHPTPLQRPCFAAVERMLTPAQQPELCTDPTRPATRASVGKHNGRVSMASSAASGGAGAEQAGCACAIQ